MTLPPEVHADKGVKLPADPESFDRPALETKVSDKLSAVFADESDILAEEPAKPSQEAAAVVKEPSKEEPAAEVIEQEPTKEVAASEPAAKPTAETNPTEPVIPAAYRRSLKAYEWTDEEIDGAAKANLDGFLKMADKMHRGRVEETRRWAEMGRQQKANAATVKVEEPKKFQPIDIAKLRARYGNEEFIDELEKQNAVMDYIQNQAMPFIQSSRERQQAQEMDALNKQVDGFFGAKEMEPYHDHYGKAGQTLTEQQATARQKVLETTDLLISGARSTGRPITLDEALTMAHDSVSSPIAAKTAVKKVEQQVRTRQSAITMRPGSRGSSPPANDRKDLEGKVKTGLKSVFRT